MNGARLTGRACRIVVSDVGLRAAGLDVRGHPIVPALEQRRNREHQLRCHRYEGNDAEEPVPSS
jgi:hypothetical protein